MFNLDLFREYLSYDPETGVFRWIKRPANAVRVGDIAENKNTDGYCGVRLKGTHVFLHRLAWAFCYGHLPDFQIDHKNLDRGDNRIANLRKSCPTTNSHNRKRPTTNTSGHKSVFWIKRDSRWLAFVVCNGKRHYGGHFKDRDEAIERADRLRESLHGEFANHG